MATLKSQSVKKKRYHSGQEKRMEYFEKKGMMSKEMSLTIKLRTIENYFDFFFFFLASLHGCYCCC